MVIGNFGGLIYDQLSSETSQNKSMRREGRGRGEGGEREGRGVAGRREGRREREDILLQHPASDALCQASITIQTGTIIAVG